MSKDEKSKSESKSKKAQKAKPKSRGKSGKKVSAKSKSSSKAKKPSTAKPLPKLAGLTTFLSGVSQPEKWFLVDAKDQVLGDLASRIAHALRGKNRPEFHPSQNFRDFVVVINAEKVKLTGKKLDDKIYYTHSQYMGHLRRKTARTLLATHPERLIELAVKRMITNHRLGRAQLKKLFVYPGADHPHKAQNPQTLSLGVTSNG